ncbi:MAG: CoA pyrophosphatase [Pseudomonadota bacterium]
MDRWKERLRASLAAPIAAQERYLFNELNPDLVQSPILKEPPRKPREAAVLIGIRATDDPTVIMTLRAPTMPSHAGQISLPGGTPKEDDDGLIGTALREMDEEVGVPPDAVDVLGHFGPHHGGLGYVVTPVLGIVDPDTEVIACPREVSEAFEVPLRSLADPENHIIEERVFNEVTYNMFAVPVADSTGAHRNIWGLTAGILHTMAKAYHA